MPANGYEIDMSLNMTANTEQAKAKLQELQQTLDNLTSKSLKSNGDNFLTKDIIKATNAASQLKSQLEQATNVKTGQLDIGKLSQSLKASGMTLEDYRVQFNKLGPEGTAAFNQIASSITNASIPMKQTGRLLNGLMTNLKKVAAWQISSSILHGFMGSISKAYQYVQDLNESLNNIQIVTGQNTEQMAKFAEQANKSAKALSTTTVDYTDAALIFYQQGLKGKDVTDRTDVVMKMANVTKESAADVSSQMTAIWNNFYDGSESLEHYADVITNLGAHTASSSKEIAEGLEKFAAIGDTVGLSYDYATSALATVVAQTRQSADTVGTSFKTIFSRLEGLQLGKTLDDGTDLNKYSMALQKVGVDIKTSSGELKNMDTILDDLGERWKNLEQDQKMALAQTVGGVRQYTQLIALMDNWDTFKENLGYAQSAEGTLQGQQDIYAESWEGASKRVQAAAEDMYSALLNDKFFIQLTNLTGDIINGFTAIVKSMGGLPQLLLTIGPLLTTYFGPQLAGSLDRAAYNAKLMFENLKVSLGMMKQEETEVGKLRVDAFAAQDQQAIYASEGKDPYSATQVKLHMEERNQLEREFYNIKDKITELEQKQLQEQLDQNKELQEELKITEQIAAEKSEKFYDSISNQNKKPKTTAINYQQTEARAQLFEKIGMYHDVVENKDMVMPYNKLIETIRLLNEEVTKSEEMFETAYGTIGVNTIKTLQDIINETELKIQKLNEQTNNLNLEQFNSQYLDKNNNYKIDEINKAYNINISQKDIEKATNPIDLIKDKINQKIQEIKINVQKEIKKIYEGFSDEANNFSKQLNQEIGEKYTSKSKLTFVKSKPKNEKSEEHFGINTKDENYRKMIKNIAKDANITTEEVEKQLGRIGAYYKTTEEAQKAFEKRVGNIFSDKIINSAKDYANQLVEVTINGQKVTMSVEEMKKKFEELNNKPLTFGQTMAGLATITMSVTSLINGFKNLAEVWSSDASVGEKLFSTFTTLGSVMMSMSMLLTQQNQKILENIGVRVLSKLGYEAETAATAASIPTKVAETGATQGQTAANVGLLATMPPLLAATLAITAAILALIAIVWLIAAAFEAWKQSTPEGKLKSAQETSAALGEELTRTKQAADDLKKSFENYDNAVKKLEDCAKGTQEWKDALNEANEEALKLANLDPVNIKLERDENTGLLTISEESKQAAINAKNLDINRINFAKHQSDQQARDLQSEIDIINFSENSGNFSTNKLVRMAGNRIDGPTSTNNTLSQEAQNAAVIKIVQNLSNNLDKLDSLNSFEKFANGLGVSNNSLIKGLYENKKELIKLTNTIDINNKLKEQENIEDVKKVVEAANSSAYQTSNYKNDIDKLISSKMSQTYTDQKNKDAYKTGYSYAQAVFDARKEGFNDPLQIYPLIRGTELVSNNSVEETKKIKEYAKLKGYSNNISSDQYKIDNGKVTFTINGDSIETTMTEITSELYSQAVEKAGEKAVKIYSEIANKMKEAGYGSAFSYVANQSFDNLNRTEINKLGKLFEGKNVTKETIAETLGISSEELETILQQQNLSFKQLKDNIINNYSDTIKDITTNLSGFDLNKEIADKVTVQQSKDIKNAITKVNTKEARDQITSVYNDILSGLNKEDFAKALSALNDVDWSSASAVDQAKQKMEELGIKTNYTSEQWKELGDKIAKSNGNLPIDKYEKLKNLLSAINDIGSELKIGDTISKTDYNSLVAINSELEKYFVLTSNGKYKVIDDSFKNDISYLNSATEAYKEFGQIYNQTTKIQKKSTIGNSLNPFRQKVNINEEIQNKAVDSKKLFKDNQIVYRSDLIQGIFADDKQYKEIREKIMNALSLKKEDLIGNKANDEKIKQFFSAYAQILEKGAKDGFDTSGIIENIKNSITNIVELELASTNEDFTKEDYQQVLDRLLVETSEKQGKNSTALTNYAKSIQSVSKSSKIFSKDLKDNDTQAKLTAYSISTLNKAMSDLKSNFKDYKEAIEKNEEGSEKWSNSVNEIRTKLSEAFGIDGQYITDDFITNTDNLNLMEKALNNNKSAFNKLRKELTKTIVAKILIENNITDPNVKEDIMAKWLSIEDWLNKHDIKIGQDVFDVEEFKTLCKDLVNMAGMTRDQIDKIFVSMGYTVEWERKEGPMSPTDFFDFKTGQWNSELIQIKTIKKVSDDKTINFGGKNSGKGSGGSKKSGSGSKSKKSKDNESKFIQEKDQYHKINQLLDAQNHKLKLIETAKDHAYGTKHVQAMNKEIKAQQKLIKLQEQYYAQAERERKKSQKKLKNEYGAKFNKDGIITNYDALFDRENARAEAARKKYNKSKQTKADKAEYKAAKKRYENFIKLIENYDNDLKTAQEKAEELAEARALLLQKRLEKIKYKIDIRLEINELDLKRLDRIMSNYQKRSFSQAEQLATSFKQIENAEQQINLLKKGAKDAIKANLKTMREELIDNRKQYSEIKISKEQENLVKSGKATEKQLKQWGFNKEAIAQYKLTQLSDKDLNDIINGRFDENKLKKLGFSDETIQYLKENLDSVYDILRNQLDEEITLVNDLFNSFWEEGKEEFENLISSMEHLGKVLTSYSNIVELTGKRITKYMSTEALLSNYQAQGTVAINNITLNKENRDRAAYRVEEAKQQLAEAQTKGNQTAIDQARKDLIEAEKDFESTQEALLSSLENALTVINEGFASSIKIIGESIQENLINTLTEGIDSIYDSFADLVDSMSKQKELRDLTFQSYKQIYETSKLMRQINQELDKTDNIKSQKQYNKLLDEVRKYQDKSQAMSKYDLDYLQKKYALTQAQIALEEARNAKSQVRLTRDAEGNYGYVYTADTSKIEQAEQAYEDKLYDLEDTMYQAQEDLSQTYVQTLQKYFEEISAIEFVKQTDINEYYRRLSEINDRYSQQLQFITGELSENTERGAAINQQYATSLASTYGDTWLGSIFTNVNSFDELLAQSTNSMSNLTSQFLNTFQDSSNQVDLAYKTLGTTIEQFAQDYAQNSKTVVEQSDKVLEKSDELIGRIDEGWQKMSQSLNEYWKDIYGKIEALSKSAEGFAEGLEKAQAAMQGIAYISPHIGDFTVSSTRVLGFDKAYNTTPFDTGGYTGEWDSSGRLALLHQKELVLNQSDTKNMLTIVDIVRNLVKDLNKLSSFGGALRSANFQNNNEQTLKQQVEIKAEFPNVQDHNEIEEALNNLVNRAAQFANTK